MRKRMAWALAAATALSVGAGSVLAGDDGQQLGWAGPFKEWNKPAPEPAAKKKADPPKPAGPTPAEEARAARNREEADLLRRLAVCDKLSAIALQNKDPDLQRQAEQLDERARSLFAERTATIAKLAEEKSKALAAKQASADKNKLTSKKDAATSVAAKGDTP